MGAFAVLRDVNSISSPSALTTSHFGCGVNPQAGHTSVFLQPIGFVCDHVEILFDIDILFRQFAQARGMKLYRAESLNDSSTFVRAIADLVRSRLVACETNVAAEKIQ